MLQISEPGQSKKTRPVIGIDLGTTNSLVAISSDGKTVRYFTDEQGRVTIPSVVHYGEVVSVGYDVPKVRGIDTVRSVKRLMGRAADDADVLAYLTRTGMAVDTESEGIVRLLLGGKWRTPVEVSADILRYLKTRAEAGLGEPVFDAVITVPAYFNDAARQATKDAARLAGLNVLRLVNEPTAAALAYGLDKQAEGTFMIYDLGGGTFDVSILKLTDGVFQVLATGGDAVLGGDDIDAAIAEALGEEDLPARIQAARVLKEKLTTADVAEVYPFTLTRAQLEQAAMPYIRRTLLIAEEVLEDSGISADELSGIVLVGGSTRMPLVRRKVAEAFGREPLVDIDPDKVVAHGAALQAAALGGQGRADMLLLDVTPLSLGLETMGGLVEKIIPRNTPIPITRAQEFTTFKDGQTGMDIHVLQGERETVETCRSLARFRLSGIPPLVAGQARVMVMFSVDADGILTVRALEQTTGTEQSVQVKPSYGLDEAEMIEMLKSSITNARADVTERMVREARLELERALEAAQAAFNADKTLLSLDDQQRLLADMATAKQALTLSVPDEIKQAMETLEDAFRTFAELRVQEALKKAVVGKKIQDVANG
ncbi:MAG: Fe-S protein assembly chaperone HscA [Proteobacteria bacterium]|nr:Fe-S protein assembly chaperone HscA [Pseudomonadota bacterium]